MEEAVDEPAWRGNPPSVVAVIVSRNGERWLPQALASLGTLDHLPSRWVAVDVSSTDNSAVLLNEALGQEHVVTAPVTHGFGQSVRQALEAVDRTDWIWLLHDDAVVDPRALSALLDEATSSADIAVVGPKIREWPSLRRLLEVGVTITSTGSRETGLETGEPDAGQHDWARDVLAVSTAGMLIRRDVWDELGGFDDELPFFFDDIDFGWRVARAGYRTRIAPTAVIFHAEASRRRVRARDSSASEQRGAALYTILANESGPRFWWQSVRLLFGSVLRLLAYLILKDPRSARGQAAALQSVYGSPRRMLRARRRRRKTAKRKRRSFASLFAPSWLPYVHEFDVLAESLRAMVRPESVQTIGRRSASESILDEDDVIVEDVPWWQRRRWAGTILAFTVLSYIAARGVLSPRLSSLVLPPAPARLGDWWSGLFERTHDVGLGSADWPASYLIPLATASTPTWFAPGFATWVLLVFAGPLGALTAHRTGRLLTDHRRIRMVWAVSYGLIIIASGAVVQGRLGTVVVLIIAPILLNVALRLAVEPTWPMTFQLAIWIAIAASFAPISILLIAVGFLAAAVVNLKMMARHGISFLLGAALAGPWTWGRLSEPSSWWWEAGRLVAAPARAIEVVAGQGGGPGTGPLAAGLVVTALGVLALIPAHTRVPVSICWAVAIGAMASVALGTVIGVSATTEGQRLDAWVGLGAAVWLASLSTAVMFAAPEIVSYGRPITVILIAVALVFPVATTVWWTLRGIDDPLTTEVVPEVPSYLADLNYTTAIVTGNIDDGGQVRVVTGQGPNLGQESMMPPAALSNEFLATMQRLVAQPTTEDLSILAGLGIDAIYAPDADVEIQRRLDSASGLSVSGSDVPGSRVWILNATDEQTNVTNLAQAPASRPWLVTAWLFAWAAVAIGAVPVRRTEEIES